jgi:hypothetical protein
MQTRRPLRLCFAGPARLSGMAVGRESLLPSWDLPVCRAICEEKDAQWYGAIEVKWIVKAGRICVVSPWRAANLGRSRLFRRPEPAYSGSVGRKHIAVRRGSWPAYPGALKRGWGCGGRGWRLNPLPPPSTQYPRSASSGTAWRQPVDLHYRWKMSRLHFAGKMFQTRMGFGSRCYESCRPTHDVYFQSFEQRERFASPTNTQNSSGGTTTQL